MTLPDVKSKLSSVALSASKFTFSCLTPFLFDFKKSFSASQIKQIYKLTPQRLAVTMAQFGKGKAKELKCTFRKVYEIVKFPPFRDFKHLLIEFPSEWYYEGVCLEPF